jgi:prepilin-type N-terminal cleavage/methylation domain-containing protein
MTNLHRPSAGARALSRMQAGFSLVELGIVIAVIATLSLIVIASKGYITAAKKKAAIDLVNAIRTAGEQFSMRHNNGVSFSGRNQNQQLSLKALQGQFFLPQNLKTPWEEPSAPTDITILPDDGPFCQGIGGAARCDRCTGNACMSIDFPVPDDNTCKDMASDLTGVAVAVQCVGQHIRISTR